MSVSVKLEFSYGPSPDDAKDLSIVCGGNLQFGDGQAWPSTDYGRVQRGDLLSGASGVTHSATDIANMVAFCFQQLQPSWVQWFPVRVSTGTGDGVAPILWAFVGDIDVISNAGVGTSLQEIFPDAVAGVEGKVAGSGAPRLYSVGLLTPTAADVSFKDRIDTAPWTTTDEQLTSLAAIYTILAQSDQQVVSSAKTKYQVFRNVTLKGTVYKSTHHRH